MDGYMDEWIVPYFRSIIPTQTLEIISVQDPGMAGLVTNNNLSPRRSSVWTPSSLLAMLVNLKKDYFNTL